MPTTKSSTSLARLIVATILLMTQLLSGCGGGGSSNTNSTVAVPQNVKAVAGDGQVTLSWSAVPGAASYSVYWNDTGNVTNTDNALIVTKPLTSHPGLVNTRTYYYRVTANISNASSLLTSEVSATPQPSLLGKNWTQITSGTTTNLKSIGWSGSGYVTGGTNESLTSSDGITWSVHSTLPLGLSFTDLLWDGSQFVSVGISGTNGVLDTSPDGISWTPRVVENNKPLYVLHRNGTASVAAGVNVVLTSADWISAIQQQSAPNTIYGITWDGSRYFAVGDDSQTSSETIMTSTDTVTWISHAAPAGVDVLNDIIYTGVAYLAVGNGGTILLSFDGTTWETQISGSSANLKSVVWTGNMFVVAGESGTVLTSNDGVNWTGQSSGVIDNLQDVSWSGSKLVVVGDNGTIISN